MTEKNEHSEATLTTNVPPPSYEVAGGVSHMQEDDAGPFRDEPKEKQVSALSYSSESVGPASRSYRSDGPSWNLFSSSDSKRKARQSLQTLYSDIIAAPSSSTVDIFRTILETCKKGNISLESITGPVNKHLPAFWMVVHAKQMPGTIELFLSQEHPQTRMTVADLEACSKACRVHDSLGLYLQVRNHSRFPERFRGLDAKDEIVVFNTESPALGFIANITFHEFATRYRVEKCVTIKFPARHRLWTIRLGESTLPANLLRLHFSHLQSARVAELRLEDRDVLPCDARIRLRSPSKDVESPWLDFGKMKIMTNFMRDIILADKRPSPSAIFGPIELSNSRDWRALEFGDDNLMSSAGDLSIQLQVTAKDPEAPGEACCVQ